MQAVILAAGRGKRMGELTDGLPKPMLKIHGRPILEYTLLNLPEEVDEVVFVVGYKGEMIKEYFGDEWQGRKIKYIEQKELNGTGGAVWQIRQELKDKFLVLMGDDLYLRKDLKQLVKYDLAALVKEVAEPSRFGVVEMDKDGYLVKVVEKPAQPKSNLVVTGAYVLGGRFFQYPLVPVYEGREFGLPQTMAQMADKHKIKVVKADFWHPHTNGEDLTKAEEIIDKFFK